MSAGAVYEDPCTQAFNCSLCGGAQVWRDCIYRLPLLTCMPAHTQAGAASVLLPTQMLSVDLHVGVSAHAWCVFVCEGPTIDANEIQPAPPSFAWLPQLKFPL